MNATALREDLRQLEKQGKLEKMLAPGEAGMPWSDLVWLLQWPAYAGLGTLVYRAVTAWQEAKVEPSDGQVLAGLALVLFALVGKFCGPLFRTRSERLRLAVRRKGGLVPAAVVQANSAFGDPDNEQWLPGTLLISLDAAAMQDPARLQAVAKQLYECKHQDRRTLPAGVAEIAWDLYHEMGMLPMRAVPAAACGGLRDCFVVSAMLPPQPLMHQGVLVGLFVTGSTSWHSFAALPAKVAK